MRSTFLIGCAAFLCCSSGIWAQARTVRVAAPVAQTGTEPKPKPEAYEVSGRSQEISLGAEFMIHSFSGEGQTYIAKDYLVVEVALYPPKGETIDVKAGQFALTVNGKRPLAPMAPQAVASEMQHPDWQTGPRMEAEGGLGNTGVILGRPSQVPGGQQPRSPLPPRAPPPDNPGGVTPEPRLTADQLLIQTALPEGQFHGPVSGFIYFPFKGKTSSIRSLRLEYGDAVLTLR